MLKYSISLGLQDSVSRTEYDREQVIDVIASLFRGCGCSILSGLGVYEYQDGSECREHSLVTVVYGESSMRPQICAAAESLKKRFRQESVIVTVEPCPETLWI